MNSPPWKSSRESERPGDLTRRRHRLRSSTQGMPVGDNQGGFTLIEALVGVSLMAIIVAVMASGITMAFRAVYFQRTGATSVDEGRRILPIITKDLQVATGTDPMPVSLGPSTNLTITGRDPLTDMDYFIIYSLAGSNLVRTLDGTPRTVGRHVSTADFSVTGSVFTVTLITSSESNTRSAATNTWDVYKRAGP